MFVAYVIATLIAAVANGYAASVDFLRTQKILDSMAKVGVPESWLPLLGVLKAAGALGLLVGLGVPVIGTAAAIGLTVFFVGAIITHIRSHDRSFGFALVFLLLAVAALVLGLYARKPITAAALITRHGIVSA